MQVPQTARVLSKTFLAACLEGILTPLLERVRKDATLEIGIRCEELVVYYRGGRLVSITACPAGFRAQVHENYLKCARVRLEQVRDLVTGEDAVRLASEVPWIKEAMDLKLGEEPKDEREYQQLAMRENNDPRSANGTDYLVCDIEYTPPSRPDMRLDMVAVRWPSTSSARKRTDGLELALVEMKFGDAALASGEGRSGLMEHFQDMLSFASHFDRLKEEMAQQLSQKARLGLLTRSRIDREDRTERIAFREGGKVSWILLLAGHDPASRVLGEELRRLQARIREVGALPFEVKVATSVFCGYGLYDEGILDLEEFLARHQAQIGPA